MEPPDFSHGEGVRVKNMDMMKIMVMELPIMSFM